MDAGRGGAAKKGRSPTGAGRPARGRRSDPFRFDRGRLAQAGEGARFLAGADEVGRGCLAGPLVVAAVVLDYTTDPGRLLKGMSDSKALTAQTRERLYYRVLSAAREISVVAVSAERIDEEGLHRCNLRALRQVLGSLSAYDLALVDGFELGRPLLSAERVIDGDWRSAAVASASVVAKVARDRLMRNFQADYPHYGFESHVGYATKHHQHALRLHGPCPLHRRSFSLVRALLEGDESAGPPIQVGDDLTEAPA